MAYAKTKIVITSGVLAACLPVTYQWIESRQHPPDELSALGVTATESPTAPVGIEQPDLFRLAGESVADLMLRILAIEDTEYQRAEMRHLVIHASPDEIAEALAVLIQSKPEDSKVLQAFVEAWAEVNPGAALAYGDGGEGSETRAALMEAVVKGWARNDPEGALDHLATLPRNATRGRLLVAFFQTIGESGENGGARGLKLALTRHPELVEVNHIDQLFHNWADRDHRGALAAAQAIEDPVLRDRAIRRVVMNLGRANLAEAIAVVESIDDETLRLRLYPDITEGWTRMEPEEVARLIQRLPDQSLRKQWMERMLNSWQEPSQAAGKVRLLDAMGDPEMSKAELPKLVEMWAWSDRATAADYVLGVEPELRSALLPGLANQFARLDPDQGLAWAGNLVDGDQLVTYMSEFVGALSKTDLAAAVKIADEFDVPELVSRSLPELAVEFAKQDPQQAADWVMTTGGPAQAEAMRSVLARWSATNDEEAEAWVVDHGTAVDRDTMAAGLSEGLLGEEPDRATDWALTIADQELREERLKSILIHRVNEDSHSLARWLNTQSEDVQAQLRALDDRVAVFAPTHPTLHK